MAIPTVVSARPSETSTTLTRHHSQQQCCPHCHQVILSAAERLDRVRRFKAIVAKVVIDAVEEALIAEIVEQGGRR
jgi:transposase